MVTEAPMRLNSSHVIVALTGSVLLLGVWANTHKKKQRRSSRKRLRNSGIRSPEKSIPRSGIAVRSDRIVLKDWSAWMKAFPQALEIALREEGADDVQVLLANAMRRVRPDVAWPPLEDSPLRQSWNDMVAALGRTLAKPYNTQFKVVS